MIADDVILPAGRKLAKSIVEAKLAACVNMVPGAVISDL